MRKRRFARAAALAAGLALAGTVVRADEGMWTFDHFPAAAVKAKYGVTIDKAWLDHVRESAVRLSDGCSASLVSGEGLVLTNHHCVADCAQDLSTSEHDYVKDGFMPASRGEERQCPGMQAEILETVGDVTDLIDAATKGKSGQDFVRARDAVVADTEKSRCAGKEAIHRCQVIALYDGGQYRLYTYRRYADVRLAFAVESAAAFFGGDPDNFNFPRYDLDFSFLRLYENGAPAATPRHLRWNAAPPKAGDPVFVAGNPGGTDRLLTADQLVTLRDVIYPPMLYQTSELRGRYAQFAEEGVEQARIVNRDLFDIENALKALRGEQEALMEPSLIAAKRKEDAALRARVSADPELARELGDPWEEIARVQNIRAALYMPYYMTEARAGYGSDLYRTARVLVRAGQERVKPNAERLREYADARLPMVEKNLLDPAPVEPELERLQLAFWFAKLREELTADAPETAVFLEKDSPESLAKTLVESKLADPVLRKALWDGGLAAVEASDDPMIRYVLRTDETARKARKAYEERVLGPTDRASERIARARFAVLGTSVYPDATFSLRLSYGKVAGWTWRGRTIAPFTDFAGLYARATGQFPFALAPRWTAAMDRLDLTTMLDLSTDNDIIGGNSGSPLINAEGEIIGAIFDGNIHSLGGDFFFDPAVNRAVAVSAAAITEALVKVYGQPALLAELAKK